MQHWNFIDCSFSRMITLNTQQQSQRLTFNSFISSFSFLLSLFKRLCTKKHHVCNLYRISYTSRVFAMYYIKSEICIGGHFLEECFYCYSRQIKSDVANESLVPYNLIKSALCFFWVENCY